MKSYFIKIVLVVGIVGIIAIGYKAELIPALSDSLAAVANIIRSHSIGSSLPDKEYEIVYKWRDSAGIFHYSNEPPEGNKNAIKIKISRQQNIVHLKKPEADQIISKPFPGSGKKNRLPGILESYNNPVKKAINARSKMEQRNRELEKALQ